METKIEITPELAKEIEKEILNCSKQIEKEMAISFDLRNYEHIARMANHAKDLKNSLLNGYL